MRGMCTGPLCRCGAAALQRPSFSQFSWQAVWYSAPDLPSVAQRFCKPRCSYHRGPGPWISRALLRLLGASARKSLLRRLLYLCICCVLVFPCHIITPPDVVLFSYIRGRLSIVRFYWGCSPSAVGLFVATSLRLWQESSFLTGIPPCMP